MAALNAAKDRSHDLDGRLTVSDEIARLRRTLPATLCPDWLAELLQTVPIVGCDFELAEDQDASELGVEMRFLSVDDMIDEATEAYPGIAAHRLGYLPVGACLTGSGDYYYLDLRKPGDDDPPFVRLPHGAVDGESYREDEIEIVAVSLSAFIRAATID
ncbi:MAG: hypothetical protein AAFR04_09920 [Pseudomonadota bacterium]